MGVERRWFGRAPECAHREAVMVTTYGLTRSVCEQCGHVEITKAPTLSGEVDRSRFARSHADRRDASKHSARGRHDAANR